MPGPISLVAVGDLQLGDSPTTVGYGFYSRYKDTSLEPLFERMRPKLAGADILFGNLETTLLPPPIGSLERRELQLRGNPQFARDLRRVGFAIVNVANNHAVQHGPESFAATVEALSNAGIACCGVRGTGEWTSKPVVLPVRGVDVGFLGYCLRPRQYGGETPPYAEGTFAEICADVARLRATTPIVVVSLHWGEEFVPIPADDEIAGAHAIIDSGATAILGHHPHVTRPVERYRNGIVAYSLGNFIGDMVWYAPFRRGAVLRCTLAEGRASDVTVSATILDNDYVPGPSVESPTVPTPAEELRGLEAGAYAEAIARSMRAQRLAAYGAAVRNLRRTPAPILFQLVRQTLRNKVAALTGNGGHEGR